MAAISASCYQSLTFTQTNPLTSTSTVTVALSLIQLTVLYYLVLYVSQGPSLIFPPLTSPFLSQAPPSQGPSLTSPSLTRPCHKSLSNNTSLVDLSEFLSHRSSLAIPSPTGPSLANPSLTGFSFTKSYPIGLSDFKIQWSLLLRSLCAAISCTGPSLAGP